MLTFQVAAQALWRAGDEKFIYFRAIFTLRIAGLTYFVASAFPRFHDGPLIAEKEAGRFLGGGNTSCVASRHDAYRYAFLILRL